MKFIRFGLPLAGFITIVIFLALGLKLDPRHVPSPLIDKPAPEFTLPTLNPSGQMMSNQDFKGRVWMLNVWASWCAACKIEHPVLLAMAGQGALRVGLNYKDTNEEARAWLDRYQNPYDSVIVDTDGLTGIDWGVYGVPETFLIDRAGNIRYKHIGPVEVADAEYMLGLAGELEAGS